uniref:Transglutaminase N-terminal domain-containing protein n=1 Tax=Labrus bergylta TaxID=56723 RepID=A0A3Q3GFW1_9LABR
SYRHALMERCQMELHCETNNKAHHTNEISVDQLIVRRGQSFTLTLKLTDYPSEERGTTCLLSIPDGVKRSPKAIAVWKIELDKKSSPRTGVLVLTVTPPADAPVGKYKMVGTYKGEEMLLASLTMLFNPWCRGMSV